MNSAVHVRVPTHLTAPWLAEELARRRKLRGEGKATKTKYLKPEHLSIREAIALAEQLKNK